MRILVKNLPEPPKLERPSWKKPQVNIPKDAKIITIVHELPDPPKPKKRKVQQEKKPKPKRKRRSTQRSVAKYHTWTEKETETLIRLYNEGMEYKDMEKHVHHPIGCIGNKVRKLRDQGRITGMRNTIGWTEEQKKTLISMRKEGKTFVEIGEAIGKSSTVAWSMYQKLESEEWIR